MAFIYDCVFLISCVLDSWNKGDIAASREAQRGTNKFIAMIVRLEPQLGGAYAWKMHMDLIGHPMGPARLPYVPPTASAKAALKSAVMGWCQEFKAIAPSWCARVQ